MMTLRLLASKLPTIPLRTAWHLTELAEAKGKQALFTRQTPQKLNTLHEHALVESAVSSNRIEGVEVAKSRIGTLIFGAPALLDKDEEDVSGYRDALNLIHEQGAGYSVSEKHIKQLHRLCRRQNRDAGRYKEKDVDIIQTYADGNSRIRFSTVPARQTSAAMAEMTTLWQQGIREQWIHPMVLAAALHLDFLCIHPFGDGNGRISRLLFLLTTYHCGIEAGRYISLERLIEQNKELYYGVLEQSSQGWHEGKHDPWPAINFLLDILARACKEFEQRIGKLKNTRGEKTAMVHTAVQNQMGDFNISKIRNNCPGVGVDLIRLILKEEKQAGNLICLGRGPSAGWRKNN